MTQVWRLHKLVKLVSDPYLLYLANKNLFKLKPKCDNFLSAPIAVLFAKKKK